MDSTGSIAGAAFRVELILFRVEGTSGNMDSDVRTDEVITSHDRIDSTQADLMQVLPKHCGKVHEHD